MNIRPLFTAFLVVVLLSASLPGLQVQGNERTYTSELTGAVINIGDSQQAAFHHEYTGVSIDSTGSRELVYLEYRQTVVNIMFESSTRSPWEIASEFQQWDASLYWKYAVLDEHYSADSGWYLAENTYLLNFKEYCYVELRADAFGKDVTFEIVMYSDRAGITEAIEWLRSDVTIDGQPALGLPDYSHIQTSVDLAAVVPPQPTTKYDLTLADNKDLGLVSEYRWVSPTSGEEIEWTDAWYVPYGTPRGVPVTEDGWDGVTLITPPMDGLIQFLLAHDPLGYSTPQDWIDRWTSEEWLQGNDPYTINDITTFLSDTSATVILEATAAYGEPFVSIYTVHFYDNGTPVTSRVTSTPENIGSTVELVKDTVVVYGQPLDFPFTTEELDGALSD